MPFILPNGSTKTKPYTNTGAEVQLMARKGRLLRINIPSFRSLNPPPVGAMFIVGTLRLLYFAFELQNLPVHQGSHVHRRVR